MAAHVTGASVADGGVIATMSFSARAGGVPRGGNLRLWLTADGVGSPTPRDSGCCELQSLLASLGRGARADRTV